MNLLTRTQHVWFDIVAVLAFAVAPVVLDLGTGGSVLAYVLAGVHLVLTLATDGLPMVPGRGVPLPLHGLVEVVVGVVLALIGWLAFESTAQSFYLVMAAVILAVFAVTPYTRS